MGGFINVILKGFKDNRYRLSGTKSVVNASSDTLGKKLQRAWAGTGIRYVKKVKALGVGMGQG